MRVSKRLQFTLLFLLSTTILAAQKPDITPIPVEVTYEGEEIGSTLNLDTKFKLFIDPAIDVVDRGYLIEAMESADIDYSIAKRPLSKQYITLRIDADSMTHTEGYRLSISDRGVDICASTSAGLFYGIQSLVQLAADSRTLRTQTIEDYPRFAYRGVLIDISRHFRTKEFLMRQIDMMAQLKMNRLHLHLTDAAGWRIEIDAYPELTSYAAWRMPATWKEWWYGDRKHVAEGTEGAYGGYLTKEDAREIVAYAQARYITVIPEIEMPGHSDEVLATYPHLRCTSLPERQGDLCIGKEETFEMMQTILVEVVDAVRS